MAIISRDIGIDLGTANTLIYVKGKGIVLVEVDKNKLDDTLYPKASWFNITMLEKDNICDFTLDNGNEQLKFKIKKVLKEKTTDRYKFEILESDLAFDNANAYCMTINGTSFVKEDYEKATDNNPDTVPGNALVPGGTAVCIAK